MGSSVVVVKVFCETKERCFRTSHEAGITAEVSSHKVQVAILVKVCEGETVPEAIGFSESKLLCNVF